MSASRSAIINLTAKTASIVDNSSAKLYGSRLSKVTVSFSYLHFLLIKLSRTLPNKDYISLQFQVNYQYDNHFLCWYLNILHPKTQGGEEPIYLEKLRDFFPTKSVGRHDTVTLNDEKR